MKSVRTLTSETLKRLIAEERQKLKKDTEGTPKNVSLLNEIKKLNALKRRQNRKLREIKAIHEARKRIKALLLKRL
jgi:hypothetical protein